MDTLTVPQLKEIARDLGIPGRSSMRKAELLAAIHAQHRTIRAEKAIQRKMAADRRTDKIERSIRKKQTLARLAERRKKRHAAEQARQTRQRRQRVAKWEEKYGGL